MKKDGYVKETGSRSMHVQNRKLQRAAAPEFQQSAPPDVLLDAEAIMDPSHVFGQQSTEESSPPRVQNASPAFSASPTFKPSTVRYDRSIPNMSADRQHHVEVRLSCPIQTESERESGREGGREGGWVGGWVMCGGLQVWRGSRWRRGEREGAKLRETRVPNGNQATTWSNAFGDDSLRRSGKAFRSSILRGKP